MFRITRAAVPFVVAVLAITANLAAQPSKNAGQPVLWERVNISQQDLFLGPGGREMQPDLSQITFLKEEKGGYSKKYRIKDGAGNVWVAKLGKEAQSETAAVRIVSALGYVTEVNYLAPQLTIPGKGTFSNVRLEARPESVERGDEWSWKKNPFTGTREFRGLKLLMVFLNNWDLKDSNNVILETAGGDQYAISDLGVTFGKTGINKFPLLRWIGRSRNNPKDYARSKFVRRVKNDRRLALQYNGKNYQILRELTTEDARWLASLMKQLSDAQLRDAFRAANYSEGDLNLLVATVKKRVGELERAGNRRYTRQ